MNIGLALGELRRAACGLKTVLFALLHARIAGEVAGLFEGGAKLGISDQQRACDAMTDCAGLTSGAAANDVNFDIILAQSIGEHHGGAHDHFERFEAKVIFHITFINGNIARARKQTNAGDRFLAPSGAEILNLCHYAFLLPFLFKCKYLGLLSGVFMLGACIYAKLGEHLTAERALRHHATN